MGRRLLPFALVILAGSLATSPAGSGSWIYDDHAYILGNPAVSGQAPLWSSPLGHPAQALWRPLTVLSWRLQHGPQAEAGPLRLVNVALHLAVSLLVLALARSLGLGRPGATLAGLLFAVHPVHAEAVAWVTGRAELLAALFTLAAWLAWRSRRPGAGPACALLFGLALLSKESAIVAPLLFLATDGPGARGRVGRLAGLAAVVAAYLLGRAAALPAWLPAGTPFGDQPLTARVGLAGALLGRAYRLLAWPHPLTIRYQRDELLPAQAADLLALLGAALAISLLWRRQRPVALGLALVPLALLTVLQLVPIGATFAERFLYLPSVPFCLAAGAGLAALGRRELERGRGLGPSAALTVLALGLAIPVSRAATTVLHDDLSLWRHAARVAPDDPNARYNHGYFLEQAGRFLSQDADQPGALAELRASLRLAPRHPDAGWAHHILGNHALGVTGRSLPDLKLAAHHYRQAIRLRPDIVAARVNLASIALLAPAAVGATEARARLAEVLAVPGLAEEARQDASDLLDQLEAAAASKPSSGEGREAGTSSSDGS